jgi:membrane protein required for colicin V production
MHWMTAAALLVIALFTVLGWRAGLIRRVLELLGLVLALVLATHFALAAGALLTDRTGLAAGPAGVVGWVVLFLAVLLLTRLLAWLAAKVIQATILGWIDRVGGAVLGLVGGVLLASVLLLVAVHLPGGEARAAVIETQPVLCFVQDAAPALVRTLNGDGDLERIWERAKVSAGQLDDAVDGAREAVGERLGGD